MSRLMKSGPVRAAIVVTAPVAMLAGVSVGSKLCW